MTARPSLAASLAKALALGAQKRGWLAYIPARLIACLGIGATAAWFVPEKLWGADVGTAATIYGGILAFNSLLLAVGWGAFSKIYEVIASKDFSAFLRRNDMLDLHILFVDLTHIALAISAFVSFLGTVGLALPIPSQISRVLFAGMVGFSAYALIEAMRASAMMNDLIWDKVNADIPAQPALRHIQGGQ